MPKLRTCTACKITKPATTQFFYWLTYNNLFQSQCKLCIIARAAKWQKDNPKKTNAKNMRWRKNNVPDWNAYCRDWHHNNLESSKAIQKKWRDKVKAGTHP